jgi:iron(III) transport system substrate-binding protein
MRWLGALVLLAALPWCDAHAQSASLSGARTEGALTLYSSGTVEDTSAITDAFEKKYGVKVRLWRGSSEDILRRAVTEARGGRFDVDVAETAGPEMEALDREKQLGQLVSPALPDLMPQAVAPHRAWVMSRLSIITSGINTNLVAAADMPGSYQDLLDRKWKGRLGIEADDVGWFLAVVETMGEEKGLGLFHDIVSRNGMSIRKGHTLLANLVAAGEVPLALTVYGYRLAAMKKAGAPVAAVALSPVVALPTGIAVFRKAPHPNAAALFADFFLEEGQRILAARGHVPTNRRIQPPPPGLTLINAGRFLDESEKWTKLFNETFRNQKR